MIRLMFKREGSLAEIFLFIQLIITTLEPHFWNF